MAWTTALVLVLGIAAYGRVDGHHLKGVAGDSYLSKLANYVKSHSDPDVAPQQDSTTPVKVHFAYAIANIAEVDKEHQTYTVETYVRTHWKTGITWTKSEYGGADMITLPREYFWVPVIQPIHTAVQIKDLSPQTIILKSDGTAYYNQFYRMQGLCDVSHVESGATCHSLNALWGYSKDQVTIAEIIGDPTGNVAYFGGSKYEVTGFDMQFNEIEFDSKTYQIVDFEMGIKEKPRGSHGPVSLSFDFH